MTRPGHLPSLDGIRAICIMFVLGAHASRGSGFPEAWVRPSDYLFNGGLGVHIFFVLSGFLITYLLVREESDSGTVSLRNFYARRCIRIFPVFTAFIIVLACLDAWTRLSIRPCQYVSALTFTKNYWCGSWIDWHLWSLSVEEQFYLFWPVLFVLAPRRWRWYMAALLVALAPAFRVWFYVADWGRLRQFSFMTNMDALMIGCATALAVWSYPGVVGGLLSWRPWVGRLMALAAIYAVWLLQLNFVAGLFTVPFGPTIQAIAAAYLITSYSLQKGGMGFMLLNLRPVRYLGVLSYSIYIWQQPFFSTPSIFGVSSAWLLDFPQNIAAAVAVSVFSFHAFEKPLLGLRRWFRTARS